MLTAAHCFGRLNPIKVRLGEHDVSTSHDCVEKTKCAPIHQDIEIERFIVHNEYRNPVNDIAIIKLAQPAQLNEAVAVPCMPGPLENFTSSSIVGEKATVVGWGRTQWNSKGQAAVVGVSSPILQGQNTV